MATQEDFQRMTEKAAEDEAYFELLSTDPAAAGAQLGIDLTDDEVEAIKSQASGVEAAEEREGKGINVSKFSVGI